MFHPELWGFPLYTHTTRTLLLVPKQVTQTEHPASSPSIMALLAAPPPGSQEWTLLYTTPCFSDGHKIQWQRWPYGVSTVQLFDFHLSFLFILVWIFCFVLWDEILLRSPGWPGTHNTVQAALRFTILLPLTSRCWCSEHVTMPQSPAVCIIQLVLGFVVWFFHKAFYTGVCWMETLLEKLAHSSQSRVQGKNIVRRKKSRKFLSFKKRAHFRHA